MDEKTNTVVTAGDANYLWGLFLLAASMRRAGMDEPLLIGTKKFDARCERVLKQFGDVRFHPLDHIEHSMVCHKAELLLAADTEYATWADSDAFFTGNVSSLLPPPDHAHAHCRRREAFEMPGAFPPPYDLNEILPRWRKDIEDIIRSSASPSPSPSAFASVSSCFISVARDQERFLRVWHEMMMRLPKGDTGVVDFSQKCYHQLDESCLNATLVFLPGAPAVTPVYGMDKDPAHLFAHFCGRPKPWVAWVPSALRHQEELLKLVDWIVAEKLELPSASLPYALRGGNAALCRRFARPVEFYFKIRRKLKR